MSAIGRAALVAVAMASLGLAPWAAWADPAAERPAAAKAAVAEAAAAEAEAAEAAGPTAVGPGIDAADPAVQSAMAAPVAPVGPVPPTGGTAPRQRVGGDEGAASVALSLELGVEPDGEAAGFSLDAGLSIGAPRGLRASLSLPLALRTVGAAWSMEAGGPELGLRWAERAGDLRIEGSAALAFPAALALGDFRAAGPSATTADRRLRLSCRLGAGIAADPVAVDAWLSSGLRLSAEGVGRPSLRAGLSLAHALNDIVSTAVAAEVGAGAAEDPRGAPAFLGGAAASVSADAGRWGIDASLSLGLGGAPPRFALGLRLGLGGIGPSGRKGGGT